MNGPGLFITIILYIQFYFKYQFLCACLAVYLHGRLVSILREEDCEIAGTEQKFHAVIGIL